MCACTRMYTHTCKCIGTFLVDFQLWHCLYRWNWCCFHLDIVYTSELERLELDCPASPLLVILLLGYGVVLLVTILIMLPPLLPPLLLLPLLLFFSIGGHDGVLNSISFALGDGVAYVQVHKQLHCDVMEK